MSGVLVFSSVGSSHSHDYKHSVFSSWQMDAHDSLCARYVSDGFEYGRYFNAVVDMPGYKFPNLFRCVDRFGLAGRYDYLAVLDDDLLLRVENPIDKVASQMARLGLDLACMGNEGTGMDSHHEMINCRVAADEVWITNFCEMGSMFVSGRLLSLVMDEYRRGGYESLLDYGMDIFVSNVANRAGFRAGVFRNVLYHNPERPLDARDFQRSRWKSLSGRELTADFKKQVLGKIALS